MSSHWPVLLAILMVSAAVGFGFYTQSECERKGAIEQTIKPLPTKYVPTLAKASNAAPAAPVVPVANEATAFKTVPPPPQFVQQKAANGAQVNPGKAVGVPAQPLTGGTDRDTIFNNLRTALVQKYGTQPSATNTGFTLFVEGARVDANTTANWAINLYNDNKANPNIQSENFQIILNMIAANFEFDLNAPSHNTADGKITKRPPYKLGRLSLTIDPALNNSISITPLAARPGMPAPLMNPNVKAVPAPAGPAAPAPVAPAPVAPQQKLKKPPTPPPAPAPNANTPKNPVVDQF